MEQLFSVLALDHPDWTIPWAGIGGFLLGVGGTLSGIAAVMTARKRGRDEATIPTAVSQPDDDDGSGVSGGESIESG
jgi:hypothetical protein